MLFNENFLIDFISALELGVLIVVFFFHFLLAIVDIDHKNGLKKKKLKNGHCEPVIRSVTIQS